MILLPWWTYVLIGTVAFTCSFGAVWLAGIAFDREAPDEEPYPCGQHLGTDADGAEDWCWQLAGHDGDHLGMRQDWSGVLLTREWPEEDDGIFRQTNAAGDVVIDENPGYLPGSAPLPPLPQRLSKVPVQPEHNDPWPQCRQQSSDGRCVRVSGHMMEHDFE